MFVFRNPSAAERRKISKLYGGSKVAIDWATLGPACDEEGGLAYIEEHFNVYSDDSKQNNYHTKSVLDATIAAFINARPWLAANRSSFMQSDNAANYRDPTTEIDLKWIGTRCFSEAGMGKDEGDGNGAVIKGRFKRIRDERHGFEGAADLEHHGASMGIAGQTHAMLLIDRRNEDSGIAGRDSVCRNFGLWRIDDESITFWESLDVLGSRESIAAGKGAVGFGPGVQKKIVEFNKTQRTQIKSTGAALAMPSGGNSSSKSRQRASREEKRSAKKSAQEAKVNKEAEHAEQAEAKAAAMESVFEEGVNVCRRCNRSFLEKGWFNKHRSRWCLNRDEVREQRRRERDVPTRLVAADVVALEEHRDRISNLALVCVKIEVPKGRKRAPSIGLELTEGSDGALVVESVSGLAEMTAQISPGFVAVSFSRDGGPQSEVRIGSLSGNFEGGSSLRIVFQRPPVPIPFRGSARKGIHKNVRFTMHPEQLAWLQSHVFAGGMRICRPAAAFEAMKGFFKDKLRADTMTPMWLTKDQVAVWLAARLSEEKAQRKAKKRKPSDDELSETAKGGAKRSKKAAAAPKPGAKKKKPPRAAKRSKQQQNSESESDESEEDADTTSTISSSEEGEGSESSGNETD